MPAVVHFVSIPGLNPGTLAKPLLCIPCIIGRNIIGGTAEGPGIEGPGIIGGIAQPGPWKGIPIVFGNINQVGTNQTKQNWTRQNATVLARQKATVLADKAKSHGLVDGV